MAVEGSDGETKNGITCEQLIQSKIIRLKAVILVINVFQICQPLRYRNTPQKRVVSNNMSPTPTTHCHRATTDVMDTAWNPYKHLTFHTIVFSATLEMSDL